VALTAGDEVGRASILSTGRVRGHQRGAFAVLALLGTRERPMENLEDYRGLWHSSPVMAGLLTIFLLSLGGSRRRPASWRSGTSSRRPCAPARQASPSSAC